MARKIKVLLSKLGLDVHNRGIITVANELRNAGMEVIYLGNSLPREIIKAAIQEDVDVIGVSSLGGAHLTLGGELIEEVKRERLQDRMTIVIGGVFPSEDAGKLREMGFDGAFLPGASREEIVSSIEKMVADKVNQS
jgi:methylmalonyl-CoA mutase C-terminal domain/subunit